MLLHRLQYRIYNRLYPIISKCAPPSPMVGYGTPIKPARSTHSLQLQPDSCHGNTPGVAHSLSDMSLSSSLSHDQSSHDHSSHDHSTHYEETDTEEPHGHVVPDRENSFEDLEQFLTQLDWSQRTDLDLTSDPVQGVDSNVQDLEERALKEHLKTIVKDIHNAIGVCLWSDFLALSNWLMQWPINADLCK